VVLVVGLFARSGHGAEPGWRQLSGHVPAVVSQLTPLGVLPGDMNLDLAIGIPLRDPAGLSTLIDQIYDPRSTNYHHYLSPQEVTVRFGPTAADYQTVEQFAEVNGLTVSGRYANRMVLDVRGRVTDIQRAFQTTLRRYPHPTEARQFYAPNVEPSVPTNVPVADLWGLSDYGRPRPMLHVTAAAGVTPLSANGSGIDGTYRGRDFRTAYVPGTSLTGSGQTAAVAEFDSYYPGDITNYEKQVGYTNVPLKNVLLDNVSGLPGYSGVSGADGEVSLDIEMVISMAPGLAQLLVYEGNSPYDVFERIATDDTASEISCSWAFFVGPGNVNWSRYGGTGVGTLDSQLMVMAAQGQSFFQSSGDTDAYTGRGALSTRNGPVPVDSPYVTSVGGTSLNMNGTAASWASEVVWNSGADVGSSGGISPNYGIPAWQTNVSMTVNGGSTSSRNLPDVALTASNVYIYYSSNQLGIVSGTSCAAPLWAGLAALINQQSLAVGGTNVGLLNPALYAIGTSATYASCFHDIVTGNNIGTNTAGFYYATNGYDLCTGLGTPNGTNLINALAPPPLPFFFNQPVSRNVTNGANFTLSAAAAGMIPYNFTWLCNGTNLAAGGNISGTTSNVLTITSITTNNVGSYSLVVTNPNGSATSATALVNVGFVPAIVTQPVKLTVFAGSNAIFSVTNTGSAPLVWQWRENSTNLANGSAYSGVNTSQLTALAATTNSGGNFSVVITNLYGSVTSSSAALTVVQPPVFTVPLAWQTIQCSSNATLSVTVIATPAPAYQWSLDGAAIARATNNSLTLTNVHLPSHTVSVVVTNLYGSTTNTAALTVQDTQPPVISLYGANPFYVELGSTFSDPGATAFDACAGAEVVMVTGTVNTSTVSTNVLVYQATDGNGNIGTASRTVIVRDTTPPTILWSFTNLVLAAGTNCEASMPDVTGTNYILATDLSGTTIINESPATNAWLELGTNLVILTASDPSGNKAYSTNTIVVQDQTPPLMTGQPQSQTNSAGATAAFMLTATACTPLTYQWFFNSTSLAGQTNATLTVPGVGLANAGNYIAVATAAGGATTSSVAILTVPPPPVIQWSFTNLVLATETNCSAPMPDVTGTNYILTTVWSGVPEITQSPVTNTQLPIGANVVRLTVSDSFGNIVYSTNTIVVQDATAPVLTSQPQNLTNTAGTAARFTVTATACTPLSYQWLFDGAMLAGQTNATLTLASVDLTSAGNYTVMVTSEGGSNVSSVATLTVAEPPVVQWSFTNLLLLAVTNCSALMPDVTGTNYLQTTVWSGLPAITQNPATNTDLPIGTNQVVMTVADNLGNIVYSTNTILVQDTTPPAITSQPQSLTNVTGTAASFAVTATTCTPLSYQWLFDSTVIAGQTNATLTLASVDLTSAGNYTVTVTSAGGSTISSAATLTVALLPMIQWSFTNLVLSASTNCSALMPDVTGTNYLLATVGTGLPVITQSPSTNTDLPIGTNVVLLTVGDSFGYVAYSTNTIVVQDAMAPVLISQPQSLTNTTGSTASFAVTATACTSLSYQWLFDSTTLVGQTNAMLTLAGVDLTSAGSYTVVVFSAGGSTASSAATLVVNAPVILTVQNNPGAGFALSASGPAGASCVLEMSTDLTSTASWQALFTNDFDLTGTAWFLDVTATNDAHRFYRVRVGP